MNLALLTDGLRAEREQGITIDVAYRYFATPKRKFIIADTPGPHPVHAQHGHRRVDGRPRADPRSTRATASSSSRGATRSSRRCSASRTSCCASTRWTSSTTTRTSSSASRHEFREFAAEARRARPRVHPGVGAARRQRRRALRQHAVVRGLVAAAPPRRGAHRLGPQPHRLPVPGAVRDPARATTASTTTAATRARSRAARTSPATKWSCCRRASRRRSRRSTPPTARSKRRPRRCRSRSGSTDDLDVSRGDMICRPQQPAARSARTSTRCSAGSATARSSRPAPSTRSSTRRNWARALVKDLQYRLDVNTLHRDEDADSLSLNEIGRVTLRTTQPLFFDEYRRNREHRIVHPRRRGDERHRRRGHDPRPQQCLVATAARPASARRRSGSARMAAWSTRLRRPGSAMQPTTKRRGRRIRADAVRWFVDAARARAGPPRRATSRRAPGSSPGCSSPIGADLIAVEPVAGMRAQFRSAVPGVPLVAATAEAAAVPRRVARRGARRAGAGTGSTTTGPRAEMRADRAAGPAASG